MQAIAVLKMSPENEKNSLLLLYIKKKSNFDLQKFPLQKKSNWEIYLLESQLLCKLNNINMFNQNQNNPENSYK